MSFKKLNELKKSFSIEQNPNKENTLGLIDKVKKLWNEKLSITLKKEMGIFALCTVMVCTLVGTNLGNDVYKVMVDGEKVGYVDDVKYIDEAKKKVKKGYGQKAEDAEVLFDENRVSYEKADVKKRDVKVLGAENLAKKINKKNLCKVNAWAIKIDGKVILAAESKASAEKIIAGVKTYYENNLNIGENIKESKFKEKIELKKEAVDVGDIMDSQEGFYHLINGGEKVDTYVIKAGDTGWDIAVRNKTTFTELKAANPGFDPSNIKIGDKIKLKATEPFLTLCTTELFSYQTALPFQVIKQKSNTLYKGETKVQIPGKYGKKSITAEIMKENGVWIGSKEVSATVAEMPVNQITLEGTKNKPNFLYSGSAGGKLGKPMASLRVSCAFGASRGSRRHEGIDFRTPIGTPIYAAGSGVVIKAARSGSYGNVIFISHGGGLETRYAHCNSLLVKPGQKVQKGQMIAKSGNTGRSTGPHLHFEVRVGGAARNPMSYI